MDEFDFAKIIFETSLAPPKGIYGPVSIEKKMCLSCIHDALRQCYVDHREWFTKVTLRASCKHLDDVKAYILKNVRPVTCLTVYMDDINYTACSKHLVEISSIINQLDEEER